MFSLLYHIFRSTSMPGKITSVGIHQSKSKKGEFPPALPNCPPVSALILPQPVRRRKTAVRRISSVCSRPGYYVLYNCRNSCTLSLYLAKCNFQKIPFVVFFFQFRQKAASGFQGFSLVKTDFTVSLIFDIIFRILFATKSYAHFPHTFPQLSFHCGTAVFIVFPILWKTRNRILRKTVFGYLIYIIPVFSPKTQFVFSNLRK